MRSRLRAHRFNSSGLCGRAELRSTQNLSLQVTQRPTCWARVARAKGANAEALAACRQAVLEAAEDVEDALMTLSQTAGNVSELNGEVDALQRARDLSQDDYQGGAIHSRMFSTRTVSC